MTSDDTTNAPTWWGETDLSMLASVAVDRGIYAGRVLVDADDTGDQAADDTAPAVAVVLDRGHAEPWLIYPQPCGWAAVQARLDDGWAPVRSTHGLISDPSNVADRIDQVLDDLQAADTLPIAHPASTEDQSLYREQRDHAIREAHDDRALADTIATQRHHVRHIGIEPPELAILAEALVSDLVRAGFHLHDCNAPSSTSAYRDGGVCLIPDPRGSQILITWHPHAASAVGPSFRITRIMSDALGKFLTAAGYPTRWEGQSLAVTAERW